jgi:hypothetical protein
MLAAQLSLHRSFPSSRDAFWEAIKASRNPLAAVLSVRTADAFQSTLSIKTRRNASDTWGSPPCVNLPKSPYDF